MEKKKNNALEKAENIAEQTSNNKETPKRKSGAKKSKTVSVKKSTDKSTNATTSTNSTKKSSVKMTKEQKRKAIQDRKVEKERIRAELEKERARKRVELARIKAHKKAEKQKAKATALRERNKRRAEAKERKRLLKEQRIARREALKNESKKDRQKRIAFEKQARRDERQRVRELKAQKRKDRLEHKMQVKRARQEQRAKARQDRQRARKENRGYGGWLAAVISLGLATLILASVLTFTFILPSSTDTALESSYQRAFYDTIEQVDNIDLNLSKVLATKDGGAMQKYLMTTAINAELAERDIQELPLADEYKYYTAKVINQIADYSKYIAGKIIDGDKLTDTDKQGLERLYKANLALKNALNQMLEKMGTDYTFSGLDQTEKGDALIAGLTELENLSVAYPELIYDGPFSDGAEQIELKGLTGEQVDKTKAVEIFTNVFKDYGFTEINCVGCTEGAVECYNLEGKNDNATLYAQITKKGGKLIMFDYQGDCNEVKIESDKAIFNGLEFMQALGIDDMQEVWYALADNVYTINYAYKTDSVIVYPDMIKVRVCAQTGKVIGLEAKSYYANHRERTIDKPALSVKSAEQRVFEGISIESSRLALIPLTKNTEKLCYEFSGSYNGDTFYVYIDANTGAQVQMFKVVSGSEGTLLM